MTTTMRAMAAGALTTLALAGVGCQSSGRDRQTLGDRYANYVDPCWPERYSTVAREQTLAPFATQAANGEIIAQTIWNYHFEAASDKLAPSGVEALDMIVRKRPSPDAAVYVQTARDLAYEHDKADKLAADRAALDAKRVAQVQKYLSAQAAAKGTTFNVVTLDPADPAFYARYPGNAIQQLPARFTPTLNSGGGGGGGGGGGASGGGSSGGR
jgi:hypothetical protein